MRKLVCMSQSKRIIAVLDTNVIYPIVIRDILFWFAHFEIFIPRWSAQIFDEWRRLMITKGLSGEDADRRIAKANLAFPDALVTDYRELISKLILPDVNDRHVLAAAIRSKATCIVTNNLKDFPADYLLSFGLQAITPDSFLVDLMNKDQELAIAAFLEMEKHKKKPKYSTGELLKMLTTAGLVETAHNLRILL